MLFDDAVVVVDFEVAGDDGKIFIIIKMNDDEKHQLLRKCPLHSAPTLPRALSLINYRCTQLESPNHQYLRDNATPQPHKTRTGPTYRPKYSTHEEVA